MHGKAAFAKEALDTPLTWTQDVGRQAAAKLLGDLEEGIRKGLEWWNRGRGSAGHQCLCVDVDEDSEMRFWSKLEQIRVNWSNLE